MDRNDATGTQWNVAGLVEAARNHLISPAEEMAKIGVVTKPFLTSGEGVYVTDSRGHRLIDGPGGMWCSQIGYGRREIADAISAQAMRLSFTSPWYFVNGPQAELSERIASFAPGDLNHVFLTAGGSSAVDSALRFVQFFNNVLGRPDKKTILCRIGGYHGSTHLTAACSGRAGNRANFDLTLDTVSFVSSPNAFRRPKGMDESAFLDSLVSEFEERVAAIGAERIGAFLAEPLQASGGIVIPPSGYHKRILEICRRHDILYISDEVVTGFGRCGHWFASESVFGIQPDIITFAKGVTSGYQPLGGFVISDAVLARVSSDNSKGSYYTNGFTYSGHPVSCAAALANIEVFERDGLLAHVREVAPYFLEQMKTLSELPIVGDVRGTGLLGCVECVTDPADFEASELDKAVGKLIDQHCYELGLIVRPIDNMCVLSPPLVINRTEIDRLVSILRQSIILTQDQLAREGRWH